MGSEQSGASTVRYCALGGLGEVGMNCAVFETDDAILVLDCGVNFPDVDAYGIDVIIPDFTYLEDNVEKVVGVLITHGHQDHIGALAHLLALIDVPVWAPRFAQGLIAASLEEHDLLDETELVEYDEHDELELGPFRARFMRVNHSIPYAYAVALDTPAGRFVHTGDFKIDHHPIGEPPIDLGEFARLGEEGVRVLFSDSTNIERPGFAGSERDVRAALERVVREAAGCVFLTMFSTNMFRVQSALEIADVVGRRVLLLGRSLQRNVRIARSAGVLNGASLATLVDESELRGVDRDRLIVLCTGSQGQPRAALTRMAAGDFRAFRVQPGDTIIFSARSIPGNERMINAMKDDLFRLGAEINDSREVHCSGHAYRDEQALMIRLVRPEVFVPVHGDHRFLVKHARLARELGVGRTEVLDNGDVLEITADSTEVVARREAHRIVVDGMPFGPDRGESLRNRRRLAARGILVVWLSVDRDRRQIQDGPFLQNIGALGEESLAWGIEDGTREAICEAFEDLSRSARGNADQVREAVRLAARRYIRGETNRRPLIEVIVYEV